jgi:hypothetical protein
MPSGRRVVRYSHLFIALLALAVAVLAAALVRTTQQQESRVAGLDDLVRELAGQTDLLAAQLAATPPKGTVAVEDSSRSAAFGEGAVPGTDRLFARIIGEKPQRYGWKLTIRPAQYFTGDAAFSLATSQGRLPHHGVYIFDGSKTTMTVRLIKATPVTLAGWSRTQSPTSKPTASDLATVVTGGATPRSPWKDGWYWLSVRNRIVVAVAQEARL